MIIEASIDTAAVIGLPIQRTFLGPDQDVASRLHPMVWSPLGPSSPRLLKALRLAVTRVYSRVCRPRRVELADRPGPFGSQR